MARKRSAGLLPYRFRDGRLELFLVHPGGPFWARRDDGAWSIAKGEHEEGDDPLAAARREFAEETGFAPPDGPFVPLGEARQPGGKVVTAWAFDGDYEAAEVESNTFDMEWPRGSGRMARFPEVDRAAWFAPATARRKLVRGQARLVDVLVARLADAGIVAEDRGDPA